MPIAPAALFDLDGTLTDPKPGISNCLVYALEKLGYPRPTEDLAWCIGPPLTSSFPRLLGVDDPELVARALDLYRERFSKVGLFENAVYEGIPSCLQRLREEGIRLFVATSKPLVFAERILDHFDLRRSFDGVYGSELDGTLADKGELIAAVLESEGLDPAKTVMVGDRAHDMIGAAKAGVRGIGALYGFGSREELLDAGAVAVCVNPAEVADRVRQLLVHADAGSFGS